MPKKLLLIDDDPEMLTLETTLLTAQGFAIEHACGGVEALAKLERTTCDGIVVDLVMPGMDGYEVVRRIRELAAYHRTPIIMVTATPDRDAVRQGFDAGVVAFLHKPFTLATFRAVVQSVMG